MRPTRPASAATGEPGAAGAEAGARPRDAVAARRARMLEGPILPTMIALAGGLGALFLAVAAGSLAFGGICAAALAWGGWRQGRAAPAHA